MEKEMLTKFESKIREEKALVEKELGVLGIKDPETGDWGANMQEASEDDIADKNDLADRDEDFAVTSLKVGELELRLKDINDALAKIERNDGTYGICEKMGTPIEEDRLEANPAARTCKEAM